MAKSKANKDKEDKGSSDTPQDDDDFGLPELEYEALDDEEAPPAEKKPEARQSPPAHEESKVSSIFDVEEPDHQEIANVFSGGTSTVEKKQVYYEREPGGDAKSFTRIIIIGAVAFVLIGFAFLWWHHKDDDKKVVAKTAPKETKAEPKPAEPKPAEVKEPEKKAPLTGEVVVLSEKTGRSYVVVGSFFDGDLADDYGKQLISQGVNATIIKPFGNSRFFRVSIADFGSYQEAAAEAEKAKSTYGAEVWALKY